MGAEATEEENAMNDANLAVFDEWDDHLRTAHSSSVGTGGAEQS